MLKLVRLFESDYLFPRLGLRFELNNRKRTNTKC